MAAIEPDVRPQPSAHPVRAALAVLQADQRALIRSVEHERYGEEYHLRGGFPHRRAVIQWFQRAIVRTFGRLCTDVDVRSLKQSQTLLSAFITTERRTRYRSDPISLEKARIFRERFEARVLRPACNAAFRELRGKAGEYLGADADEARWTELDPDEQPHVAMRPGFSQLDQQQATALDRLWGGFRNREALYDWLHDLDRPSNGAVRPDLATLVDRSTRNRRLLLEDHPDEEKARRVREWFAIHFLLPAFADGVRDLDAGELVQQPARGLEVSQG